MKGREGKGPPSTDLLVCFPSRAHLTLMPKPICSPARPSEPNKRHHHHHHHRKLTARSGGQASPLLWAKSKASEIAEPTSPKVTCAGQIKVRPGRPAKPDSCKNWQSVMEEIERLHKSQKYKRKPAWIETTFGFKKDVMQFLTCLRNITFDFRCFGSFPSADVTSDEEDEDEEEVEDEEEEDFRDKGKANDESESSRTMFSKWFMVLQENQNPEPKDDLEDESHNPPTGPPPNALLLMRCRSAPAKSWLEERHQKQEEEEEEEEKLKMAAEEEESNNEKNKKKKESLVVMRYGKDFYKFSSEIANETWVVGGITDPLSRSRSWKR
ncbi:PREDICTED: protein Shroom4-like isoform X2 [Ipomoea nil]|uniref:protein Shroom4-like isoform X1 n=1 Tax=Ipomoea nil TaxID=35883 RepID=UPI0009008E87|nr:PREDICTED: protein Shroom4-like isoform X1 [Ipomoea nil]XP_019190277.1 PREDICTED: protein Shroom4-like isoform X1 [Ipomoea nil]XP_019190278.1 PREDICTED: protein Shroom4-like isoform X2 [Ipomoea nil]